MSRSLAVLLILAAVVLLCVAGMGVFYQLMLSAPPNMGMAI
jgi:hypothetical protein